MSFAEIEMFITTELNQTTRQAIEAQGVDYDELVGWVANSYGGGAYQDLTPAQMDAGQNYLDAAADLESATGSELLAAFINRG